MEDYKSKYENAIEVVKKYRGTHILLTEDVIEEMFPELKESEDEKVRKEIIATIHLYYGEPLEDEAKEMIAWLEKQCELVNSLSKGLDNAHERIDELIQKNNSLMEQLENKKCVQKHAYTKEYDFHGIKFIPKFAEGDIIKDKKRGEVSTIEDFSYDTGLYTHTYGQFPITIQDNYELVEQKHAEWSEEDEYNFAWLYETLIGFDGNDLESYNTPEFLEKCKKVINWLKSLKDRYTWKPSAFYLECISDAIAMYEERGINAIGLKDILEKLKKLREE